MSTVFAGYSCIIVHIFPQYLYFNMYLQRLCNYNAILYGNPPLETIITGRVQKIILYLCRERSKIKL